MDEAKNDVSYRTVRGREARAEALNSLVRAELSKSRMADALKMSKLRALRLAQNAEENSTACFQES